MATPTTVDAPPNLLARLRGGARFSCCETLDVFFFGFILPEIWISTGAILLCGTKQVKT